MKTRTLRPYRPGDFERICHALDCLRDARDMLRDVRAKNAADYVARAIKSVEGARRHAERIRSEKRRHDRDAPYGKRFPDGAPLDT